jgi:hypothetical protein
MNPDFTQMPRPELEERITALLLGELEAGPAMALRERIDREPELARLADRLARALELVRDAEARPGISPAAAFGTHPEADAGAGPGAGPGAGVNWPRMSTERREALRRRLRGAGGEGMGSGQDEVGAGGAASGSSSAPGLGSGSASASVPVVIPVEFPALAGRESEGRWPWLALAAVAVAAMGMATVWVNIGAVRSARMVAWDTGGGDQAGGVGGGP